MAFTFFETDIVGLVIVKTHVYEDERGIYNKIFEKNVYAEQGIRVNFTESSDIYSQKGVIRGLHYQTKESQAKLVHVLAGKMYDVALDLRKESATFGRWHGELLEAGDGKAIYIPEGFAHGFLSLSDRTIFSYQCSGKYLPEYCGGIFWDDKELNIPWPLKEYQVDRIIATDKDRNWPLFKEYCQREGIQI